MPLLTNRAFNRISRAVRIVERLPRNPQRLEKQPIIRRQPQGVRFKNTSGETCPLGALMAVNGSGTQQPTCLITKPDSTLERQYLINIFGDVEDGEYGRGNYLADLGAFLVEPGSSPGVGDTYGAVAGQWYARKNRPGFTVSTTTTFDDDGLVHGRQEPLSWLPGKADAQISKGSTGTFSIWMRNKTTGAWEDSGFNVTARALFAITPASPKGSAISFSSGEWLAGPWEC
jgi:hypothetical protein